VSVVQYLENKFRAISESTEKKRKTKTRRIVPGRALTGFCLESDKCHITSEEVQTTSGVNATSTQNVKSRKSKQRIPDIEFQKFWKIGLRLASLDLLEILL